MTLIVKPMEIEDKLDTLALGAEFDLCGCGTRRAPRSPLRFIYNAALPNGGCVPLFKVLQSNACTNDCAYCINQAGRDIPRSSGVYLVQGDAAGTKTAVLPARPGSSFA